MRPNFDSMPSNVAKAMRYPPMWSGFLDNTSSKCTDFASEPSGRLQTQGKPDCKMSWGNVCQGGGGLIFSPNICMNQNNLILVNFTPNYADMTFIDYIFRNLKKNTWIWRYFRIHAIIWTQFAIKRKCVEDDFFLNFWKFLLRCHSIANDCLNLLLLCKFGNLP